MTRYSKDTSVSSAKSRMEIEQTLERYGADSFLYGWEGPQALVGFRMQGRHIKFALPLPDKMSPEFWETPTGKVRADAAALKAWEQACRQRWRALALVIKAKLEAVESGITEFDDEFMAHIVLPDGETIGTHMKQRIEHAYATGKMPALLPAPGD